MMVILDNFMSHFLICFKHILRLNAGPFPFPSRPTPVIFEITFSFSSRHMNHIWSNGNLAWIKIWLYVEKEIWIAIVSQGFKIMEAMGSPLSHQQLLTSIPSSLPTSSNGFFIEIHENIIKVAFFIEDDIRALEHENVCNFQSASYDRPFVRVSWNTRMYISIIMCLKVWSNEIELNIRWNICLRAILASNMKVVTM